MHEPLLGGGSGAEVRSLRVTAQMSSSIVDVSSTTHALEHVEAADEGAAPSTATYVSPVLGNGSGELVLFIKVTDEGV